LAANAAANAGQALPFVETFVTPASASRCRMVFVGCCWAAALPWMFSGLAINAVNRAAADIVVNEVRRQFRMGVLEGTVKRRLSPVCHHLDHGGAE
jgi:Na+/H+-translocating membrane pyrophosphatase